MKGTIDLDMRADGAVERASITLDASISAAAMGRACRELASACDRAGAGILPATREAVVARDYPAALWYPTAGVRLCAACDDVYHVRLEGPRVPMPPGPPAPCDYHLDESRRVCSYKDAARAVTDLEAEAPRDDD